MPTPAAMPTPEPALASHHGLTQADCAARDATDPLRALRDLFTLPEGLIYLDGNSLGAMPKSAAPRAAEVVSHEWGQGLIRSWNSAGWFDMPQRLGDKIATLIGAGAGEVVATDSTSINLYKVLHAAISIAECRTSIGSKSRFDPKIPRTLVSERSNFPTDLYIAESLCKQFGWTLSLVDATELQDALTPQVGVLLLTHVNYRTGAMHDMPAINQAAHDVGALVVWDLAHSAGAVPVALHARGAAADATDAAADADFAVGCGYKYLNGGPGAPAFVWVHPRHANEFAQPLAGWWGHSAPFAFTPGYTPATGTQRYLCGTQPVVSLALLECGLDTVLAAGPLGGMAALRAKSLALTDLFIALVEARCAGFGLGLVTPRVHGLRGSQVSFSHPAAYPMMQALIARGVIGDFRAGDAANGHAATHGHTPQPDLLRFGFTPLYIGFEDVWHAVEHLHQVLTSREWQQPQFNQRHSVT